MNNQQNNLSLINCPVCQASVSKQAASCPKCGQPLQAANYQQPQFQQNLPQTAPKKGGIGKTFGVGCLGLIGFFVIAGIIGSIALPKPNAVQNPSTSSSTTTQLTENSNAPKSVKPETSGISPSVAAANFRKKIMSIPAGKQMINKIEAGEIPGVLKIYVTNAWFSGEKYQQRQITTQFFNLWQQELGTDNAILHIYDQTGHEIAGTKLLGGVWVEDE